MSGLLPPGPSPRHPAARLVVLSGPSGVGKGTVVAEIRRRYPRVWLSISATTRPRRPGEIDGVQYLFRTPEQFRAMVDAGELLEWASFAGNCYGTPRQPVEQRLAHGKSALLELDLQGARQVRRMMPQAFFVFLAPPSPQELERRLVGRGTESSQQVQARLAVAEGELAQQHEFDAVVVNDTVPRAARRLAELLLS